MTARNHLPREREFTKKELRRASERFLQALRTAHTVPPDEVVCPERRGYFAPPPLTSGASCSAAWEVGGGE